MKLLLFWLLYIAWTSASIPKHIHRRLKNAHSFHDVLDSIHVIYHPEKTNRHVHKVFPTEGPRQEVRIMSGSVMKSRARNMGKMLMAQPMMQNSDIDDHTADHLTLFGEIRQGNDTCQLQSVCVPIPIENEDPQIVIYPKCYEVMQCVGSCCESYEKCHPHSIRKVIKPIIELVYVGNDRFMLNKTMNITMEEHTSCSCYDCGPKAPSCPAGYSLGSNCKCECANYGERNNCVGNRKWNEEKCTCECQISCPENDHLDQSSCLCMSHDSKADSRGHRRRHRDRNSHNAMDESNTSIASLPSLKSTVVHRN